jgi:general stress protein 26
MWVTAILILFSIITPQLTFSQNSWSRDTLITAALEIIQGTNYCALATIDSTGRPQVRTMNPFPANSDLTIWFATSRTSRKVKEIRANPRVCVYFADHISAKGYASIKGTAEVIDDRELLFKMKREYWNGIPEWQEKFVLIKVIPETLEVINYKHGLNNNPDTFRAPSVDL